MESKTHYELSISQVRLNVLSTVVRVATRGDYGGGCICWTTVFRLTYSEDCVNFKELLDVTGNNKVIKCSKSVYCAKT